MSIQWKQSWGLYRSEVLNQEKWAPHFGYTLIIAVLMTGIWWHIFSIQLYIAFLCVGQSLIFSGVMYLALASRVVFFKGCENPICSKPLRFLFFVIFLFMGICLSFGLTMLANPLFINEYTCGTTCQEQLLERGQDTTLGENLIFAIFLSVIFLFMGYAYQKVRLQLKEAVEKLKQKEMNEQRLLKLKFQAELQALQASINPHFLYNTLNSIASLIAVSPQKAEEAIIILSKLFRMNLMGSIENQVTLGEVMTQAELYLKLEKLRFGDRLSYEFCVEESVKSVRIPALMVQPLVENAIKHGIAPKIEGGKVEIVAFADGGNCKIRVTDNGVGWQQDSMTKGSGYGLTNIKERLRILYGSRAQFEIFCQDGVEVELTIPL